MQLYFISRVLFPPLYFFFLFAAKISLFPVLGWHLSRHLEEPPTRVGASEKSLSLTQLCEWKPLNKMCLDLFYNDILLLFNNVISLALPTIVLMFPLTRNLSLKSKNRGWLQIFEIYIGLSLQTLDILWSEEIRIPWRLVSHLLKY